MDWNQDPPPRRASRPLGDVLTEFFVARGLGRARGVGELETAWLEVAGGALAAETAVLGSRHGVVSIGVSHPALLEELAAFRKTFLLKALRQKLPNTSIRDLRFRIGRGDSPATR
jgi:predicted nucleic acid-binding Zn ribbon protein